MTTAFVLAGGASLGSIQVGMLRALLEAGVQPDLLVGTSVGALNASVIAGAPNLEGTDELAEIWRSIKRSDVFPATPWHGALALAGRRSSLIRPDALRRLLESHVRFERLEQATVPLYVVAVEVQRGEELVLSRGPAVDAVLASAAIPGVFPPVQFGEHVLMDGGVANNTPISAAADLGAHEIYVLPTGHACALAHPPASALGMALQALSIMMSQRVAVDAERCVSTARLHVVPPLCPLDVSPADFSRSGELIERGYQSTQAWLGDPARSNQLATALLRPHSHM